MSNPSRPILAIAIALAVIAPQALMAKTPHDHHASSAQSLRLNQGQKWPTDATLREAMSGMRGALMAVLDDIHHQRLPGQGYVKLAEQVDFAVADIVANCKLTPEADAQFHVLLATLMQATSTMRSASLIQQRQGAINMLGALQQYPVYFDDPGFVPIKH